MAGVLSPDMRRALIMAGGTGGHVYPALAVAEALRARGWQVDWVGTSRGLESRVVPASGFALHTLPVRGLRGKGFGFRVGAVFRLLASLFNAVGLVRRLHPHVVLGMGGYASGPAGLAAWLLHRPVVIHEQNAVAGTTNRWLAPIARRVLCGLPGAFKGKRPVQLVGNPVRDDIAALYTQPRIYPDAFTAERPMRLLVLGGSLGSMPLNEGVPAAIAALPSASQTRVRVIHQCGDQHRGATEAAYEQAAGVDVSVAPFIENMAETYLNADLVICRAGALTVAEIAITGLPAILVPLPHAIDDHQTRNAESLSSHGAARLLRQADLTPTHLAQLIGTYIESPAELQTIADHARKLSTPAATTSVIDVLEEVADVR